MFYIMGGTEAFVDYGHLFLVAGPLVHSRTLPIVRNRCFNSVGDAGKVSLYRGVCRGVVTFTDELRARNVVVVKSVFNRGFAVRV